MHSSEYEVRAGRRYLIYGVSGLVVFAILVLIIMGMTGQISQNKTASNEWGCQYGGGPIESKGLKKTIAPGDRGGWSVMDSRNAIPADIRTYVIDDDPAVRDYNAVPFKLPTRGRPVVVDGVEIASEGIVQADVELQARFTFNEEVCVWYDKIGKNAEPLDFGAAQGVQSGWAEHLNLTWYRKIRESARPIISKYDWLQLYNNVTVDGKTVYDELAAEISANLSKQLEADLGGNFFCGPSYVFDGSADGGLTNGCPAIEITIDRVLPPQHLIDNYEAIVANAEAQLKIASDRDKAIAQAEADAEQAIATAQAQSEQAVEKSKADQAAQLAEQERREEVGKAEATADLNIANAQAEAISAEVANFILEAQAQATFCKELASVGESCSLYEAGKSGTFPRYIFGDGVDTSVLLPTEN